MNDSLASYRNTPAPFDAHASLCLQEGREAGKQPACRSISWGQGNTLSREDTRISGQREETEHSLGRHLWLYFPKDIAVLQTLN